MNIIIRVLGTAVLMAALTACQSAFNNQGGGHDPVMPLNLTGSEWGPVNNPFDQFIAFKSGGEVSGYAGCNQFFGTYELTGDRITFGPLASTRRACAGPQGAAETDFFNLLDQVRTLHVHGHELHLMGEGEAMLATLRRRDWD